MKSMFQITFFFNLSVSFQECFFHLCRITATVDAKLYSFIDKIFSAQDVKSRQNILFNISEDMFESKCAITS